MWVSAALSWGRPVVQSPLGSPQAKSPSSPSLALLTEAGPEPPRAGPRCLRCLLILTFRTS